MSALEEARARVQAWYGALEPGEQRLVRGGAALGALLLVGGAVLQLHAAVARAEQRLAAERADVAYIRSVLPELRAAPLPQVAGQSLVTVVDRTTRDSGLGMNLRGADPSGVGGVRVRLEGAAFDALVQWLLRIEREYGLAVQSATLERTDAPGRVNANLTLVAG
jgi:general secretion pathway protein M